MKLTIVFLILWIIALIYAQLPSLPTPPSAFTTTIEVTHVNENSTFSLVEYYDYYNNRARLDLHGLNGTTHPTEVYYTDWGIHFTYDRILQTCSVHVINNDDRNMLINSNNTLRSPSQVFFFGSQGSYIWNRTQVARGILCNVWTRNWNATTNSGLQMNYTMDYYFSAPSWHFENLPYETQVPVRLHLYGSYINTTANGSTTYTETLFEYVNFLVGSPMDPTIFDAPEYCNIVYPTVPYPTLPTRFRTSAETTFIGFNSTMGMEMFYDQGANKFRIEYIDNNAVTEQFWDLNKQLHYIVDRTHQTCLVLNASTEVRPTWSSLPKITDQIFTPQQLFNFGEMYIENYRGRYTVRGIRCDRWDANFNVTWVSNRTGTVMIYNYTLSSYFSVPEWQFVGVSAQKRVPIRSHTFGQLLFTNSTDATVSSQRNIEILTDYTDFSILVVSDAFVSQSYCYNTLNSPPLPSPPQSFSATLELNNVIQQTSTPMYQFWDYKGNRARIDLPTRGAAGITVFLDAYSDQIYTYDLASQNCTVGTLSTSNFSIYDASTGRLKSFNDLIMYGPQYNNVYYGVESIRGIDCDRYQSRQNYTNSTANQNSLIPYTIDHYFMTSSWSQNLAPSTRMPVRMIITADPPTQYQVYMEFIDYFPGVPTSDWFVMPSSCQGSTPAPVSPFNLNGWVSKPVAGVIGTFSGLGGVLVGGVVGFAICYLIFVKRLGRSKTMTFQRSAI